MESKALDSQPNEHARGLSPTQTTQPNNTRANFGRASSMHAMAESNEGGAARPGVGTRYVDCLLQRAYYVLP